MPKIDSECSISQHKIRCPSDQKLNMVHHSQIEHALNHRKKSAPGRKDIAYAKFKPYKVVYPCKLLELSCIGQGQNVDPMFNKRRQAFRVRIFSLELLFIHNGKFLGRASVQFTAKSTRVKNNFT
jgi:hypothetical protein